jgi:hypothetical protein
VKTGPDFEKARHTASDHGTPLRRFGDAVEDLEERALAGAVAANDAEDLALLDVEADVLGRPDVQIRSAKSFSIFRNR